MTCAPPPASAKGAGPAAGLPRAISARNNSALHGRMPEIHALCPKGLRDQQHGLPRGTSVALGDSLPGGRTPV